MTRLIGFSRQLPGVSLGWFELLSLALFAFTLMAFHCGDKILGSKIGVADNESTQDYRCNQICQFVRHLNPQPKWLCQLYVAHIDVTSQIDARYNNKNPAARMTIATSDCSSIPLQGL